MIVGQEKLRQGQVHGIAWQLGRGIGYLARRPEAARLKALTIRNPGRVVIVLGSIGWLVGLVGASDRTASTRPTPTVSAPVTEPPITRVTVPPEYVVLASHLVDAWHTSPGGREVGHSEAQDLASLRNAALDLAPLSSSDPDIAAVVTESRSVLVEMATSMERLLALPRPPGQLDIAAESFLRGLIFDTAGIARRYDQLSGIQENLVAEVRRFVALLRRGETAKLMLPRLAARHAGLPRRDGAVLAVDLDAAWGAVGPGDWLTLVNASGADLHNATVLVEVRGAAGDSALSVHFEPLWPAGAARQAWYTRGDLVLDATIDQQTVPNVAGVVVSLWSEELRQEGIQLTYAGTERDADVTRYCSAMQIQSRFRPFKAGLVWNTERGMELTLDGIAALPSSRVTARFRRGRDERGWFWDFPSWNRGERKVITAGPALAWDPDEVTIEVSFADTNFKHVSKWSAK